MSKKITYIYTDADQNVSIAHAYVNHYDPELSFKSFIEEVHPEEAQKAFYEMKSYSLVYVLSGHVELVDGYLRKPTFEELLEERGRLTGK